MLAPIIVAADNSHHRRKRNFSSTYAPSFVGFSRAFSSKKYGTDVAKYVARRLLEHIRNICWMVIRLKFIDTTLKPSSTSRLQRLSIVINASGQSPFVF